MSIGINRHCYVNKYPYNLLSTDLLRDTWKFDGYVVSDCGAIEDIFDRHHYVDSLVNASAVSLVAGINPNPDIAYMNIVDDQSKYL